MPDFQFLRIFYKIYLIIISDLENFEPVDLNNPVRRQPSSTTLENWVKTPLFETSWRWGADKEQRGKVLSEASLQYKICYYISKLYQRRRTSWRCSGWSVSSSRTSRLPRNHLVPVLYCSNIWIGYAPIWEREKPPKMN